MINKQQQAINNKDTTYKDNFKTSQRQHDQFCELTYRVVKRGRDETNITEKETAKRLVARSREEGGAEIEGNE